MVEKTKKSAGVATSHQRIMDICGPAKDLNLSDMDLNDISRQLCKMPDRTTDVVCRQTMSLAFDIAAEKMTSDHDKEVLNNMRKLMGIIGEDLLAPKPKYMDCMFFPNKKNVDRIVKYISMAKKTLLICIFTLTNDDLAKAVMDRKKAGVDVRMITDDECASAKGSDIQRMADAGIPIRTDDAPTYHMHDKFMVVDESFVMTGSFNWTYSAGAHNQENLAIIDNKYYVDKYSAEFNKLWKEFEKMEVESKAQHKAASTIQKQYKNTQPKRQAKNTKIPPQTSNGWGL